MKEFFLLLLGIFCGFYMHKITQSGSKFSMRFESLFRRREFVEKLDPDEGVEIEPIYFTLEENFDLVLYAPIKNGSFYYDSRKPGVKENESIPYVGRRQFKEKMEALFRYDYIKNKGLIIENLLENGQLRLIAFRFSLFNRIKKERLFYEFAPRKTDNGYESFHNRGFPTEDKPLYLGQEPAQFDPKIFFADPSSPQNECSFDMRWLRGTKSALTRYPRLLTYYLGHKDRRLKCLGSQSENYE